MRCRKWCGDSFINTRNFFILIEPKIDIERDTVAKCNKLLSLFISVAPRTGIENDVET